MNDGKGCPRRVEVMASITDPTSDKYLDNVCSYCGSMDPDEFMRAAESGIELGPTDKNYKVYVGNNHKFYFQHLSEDQREKFVRLLNHLKLNIGMPGYFYVLPFFMSAK